MGRTAASPSAADPVPAAAAPGPDRADRRREATRTEIVRAAWELARRDGIAELSLRALAAAVGMKAPSLYSYFPSKSAIYDALFAEGYRELDAQLRAVPRTGVAADDLAAGMRTFLAFCVADLPRYQLLFTRVVPGWQPSAEAYEASRASYDGFVGWFGELGITDQRSIDLWTGLTAGFAAQQVANDPCGDRWIRLVDDAVGLFLAHTEVGK